MLPRNIKILGFKFFGGDSDGCMFVESPKSLKDTCKAIEDAKAFLKDSGSRWVEMTMIGIDGSKDLVKMYAEAYKDEATSPNP